MKHKGKYEMKQKKNHQLNQILTNFKRRMSDISFFQNNNHT